MKLFLDSFPVGLFQCNCSILGCPQSKEAIVIDPGEEGDAITKRLKAGGWTVKALIHTHAHLDHFGATADVKACCGGRSYLNKADQFLWDLHETQSMMLGLPRASVDPVDEYFQDGQILSFGQHSLEVLFTPGHTPGSTCFRLASGERQMIFSGDTLFRRSVGRTDLPGGDFDELAKSIKTRLYTLDGDSEVIPGHGPATRIGDERRGNPFVRV